MGRASQIDVEIVRECLAILGITGGGGGGDLVSTDPGAAPGPVLSLRRESPSPQVFDQIGAIDLVGRNNLGEDVTYVRLLGHLDDPVAHRARGMLRVIVQANGGPFEVVQLTRNGPIFIDNRESSTSGPDLILRRDNPFPRANDEVGSVGFVGRTTEGFERLVARCVAQILDPETAAGRLTYWVSGAGFSVTNPFNITEAGIALPLIPNATSLATDAQGNVVAGTGTVLRQDEVEPLRASLDALQAQLAAFEERLAALEPPPPAPTSRRRRGD